MNYKLLNKIYYSDPKSYKTEYESRIKSPSAITFDVKIKDNTAFLMITPEVFDKMYEISRLDRKLTDLTNQLPEIALEQYIKKCLIEEIILTNEIEGVVSTRRDVFDALAAQEIKENNKRLFGLVKRYEKLNKDEELNFKSCQDIRNIYDDLALPEVIAEDPEKMPDGIFFRKHGVNVVSSFNKILHQGITPENELNNAITSSLEILNNSNINILLRISVFHYLFGYIHPFYDGNGRTSRFISSYLLSKNFNVLTGYRLAYTIKENITAYYNGFKLVNDEKNKGDLTPFVIVFFDIIIKLFNNLIDSITVKYDQLKYCNDISKSLFEDKNSACIAFILLQNTIFGTVGITTDELTEASEKTKYAVRKTLKILKDKNLLSITKEDKRILYNFNLKNLQ